MNKPKYYLDEEVYHPNYGVGMVFVIGRSKIYDENIYGVQFGTKEGGVKVVENILECNLYKSKQEYEEQNNA